MCHYHRCCHLKFSTNTIMEDVFGKERESRVAQSQRTQASSKAITVVSADTVSITQLSLHYAPGWPYN